MDYAAATPMSKTVRAAMEPYFAEKFYNPSATYLPAVQVRKDLEQARQTIAQNLGARPAEITFTAGATEANNLAIHGVMRQFPDANIVVSAVEHESVLAPASAYDVRVAPVQADGTIALDTLGSLIDENTVVVSVMYANNEVGTIQPLREVAALIESIRKKRAATARPLYFHTDAAQAVNYLDIHVARLGIDMLSLNGGKLYGPKQSGALYVRGGMQLASLISGGGQEHGLRSGTENVAGCVGLAAALQETEELRASEVSRLKDLQQHFFTELETRLPNVTINGSRKKRLPNNVHITLPGTDNERLLLQLEQVGILAAAGSACSASNDEPSHVLSAMGCSEVEAQSSLRFSLGRQSTQAEVDYVVDQLVKLFV
jgi:cysteine desulfurase